MGTIPLSLCSNTSEDVMRIVLALLAAALLIIGAPLTADAHCGACEGDDSAAEAGEAAEADEAGDEEAGDEEAGDEEAGDDEAGDDEAGDDEAAEGDEEASLEGDAVAQPCASEDCPCNSGV